MPLRVQCQCGQSFQVLDDLAGKRVKCPGCQQIVSVSGPVAAAAPEPEDEPDAPKKKKKSADAAQKKKMMIIGGSVGGAVLLLSLCCCGGVGAWFFFLRGPGDPEKVIIGKWTYDLDSAGVVQIKSNWTKEFNADNSYVDSTLGTDGTGTWKMISKTDNTIKIETKWTFRQFNQNFIRTYDITAVDKNHIEIKEGGATIKFKRL